MISKKEEQHMNQNLVFYDDATGMPLFHASLPSTFAGRVKLTTETSKDNTRKVSVIGMAKDSGTETELYFESGKVYTDDCQPGTLIVHPLCSAAEQLDELAAQFTGLNLTAVNQFYLPEEVLTKLRSEGEKAISKNLQVLNQVGNMGEVPVYVNCTGTLFDGAMSIYPFQKDGAQKTLYSAIWRYGFTIAVESLGRLMTPSGGNTTWVVPYVVNLVADGAPDAQVMAILVEFVKTFDVTPELKAYSDQIDQANTSINLNEAARISSQNQAMINQMWQNHNAAWARAEAFSKSLSQDMDRFWQGLAENSAAMDAFHNSMHSMNQSPSYGGFSSGESLDDKVQRWRHESMMGVNTYEREDGSTYEHTIQDDRVFENNLDSNTHFGTQNYFDDYVPDGWTELNRKK